MFPKRFSQKVLRCNDFREKPCGGSVGVEGNYCFKYICQYELFYFHRMFQQEMNMTRTIGAGTEGPSLRFAALSRLSPQVIHNLSFQPQDSVSSM